jgi:hypothetical protein
LAYRLTVPDAGRQCFRERRGTSMTTNVRSVKLRLPCVPAAVLPLILLAATATAQVEPEWSVHLSFGSVYNIPTPLHIEQDEQPDLDLTARYGGRSLDKPLYYVFRIARWSEGRAWELELVHQKLHLKNRPTEVQRFEITHGFNLVLLSHAWGLSGLVIRVGGGGIITHPETTVRQRSIAGGAGILDRGYYISGAALQIGADKRADLYGRFFGNLEGKFTASIAQIPIEDGHADIFNLALHGLIGLGYRF